MGLRYELISAGLEVAPRLTHKIKQPPNMLLWYYRIAGLAQAPQSVYKTKPPPNTLLLQSCEPEARTTLCS